MTEEKLCSNCKWEDLYSSEEPCCGCRYAMSLSSEEYKTAPLLWEARYGAAESTVEHPKHYNQGKYECIDVMVETFGKEAAKNFCLLNAFKYVWRTGEKNGVEDIKKAIWYLNKILELEGEQNEQGNAGAESA